MTVTQILTTAWKAVEEAHLPERVQGIAFEQAIQLVSGGLSGKALPDHPQGEQPTPKTLEPGETANSNDEEYFAKFSEESEIEVESLRAIYLFSDGNVKLGVSRRRLGETEAEKNRAVALLLAGAKWYAQGEASLPIAEVRAGASQVGYTPSRNLGAHLDSVPGTQSVGVKNDKAVRVQGKKFDEPFRDLITKILSSR